MSGYYLFARIVQSVVVLLVMSLVVYGLIGLMPGDPIDLLLQADPSVTAADAARLKALYGLDRPLLERWLAWLGNVARGDLGYSRLYAVPVVDILLPRLLNTLLLMGSSLVLALVIAVPIGVVAALRRQSWLDHLINVVALAGFSMPSFWLALLMILLFAVELGWLPAGGVRSTAAGSLLDWLRYLVLPASTLTLLTAAGFIRFVRAAVLETLAEPFVRTARALGCGTTRLVVRHMGRHIALPLVTLVGLHLGTLFSGAVVVETVFAYLGMGKLIYDAVLGNDFNLALVALMLATLLTLVANLLADLVQLVLDPRVQLHG